MQSRYIFFILMLNLHKIYYKFVPNCTKKCITTRKNDANKVRLHQKSTRWALDIVLFYSLVLMLLTKFLPNKTLKDAVRILLFWIMMLNLHQIYYKFVPNSTKKCITAVSWCSKGSSTKMQKCSVGIKNMSNKNKVPQNPT